MIWMQTVAFGVTSQRDTAKAQQGHQHTQEVGFEEKEKRERERDALLRGQSHLPHY